MKKQLEGIALVVAILARIALTVVFLWSYVLCFQVNGTGKPGIISFLLTLFLPVVAQIGWGWWAFVHGNPYFQAIIFNVVLWAVAAAIFAAAQSMKSDS